MKLFFENVEGDFRSILKVVDWNEAIHRMPLFDPFYSFLTIYI